MERSGFFDANLVSGTYDRKYVSQDFADYFASFISNGIFGKQLDELMVVASNPNAMSVTLKPGRAYIGGRWYENDKDMAIAVGTASGTYARIDNVVIHWSKNDRDIRAEVVEGIPSASPSAPELRRSDDEFDLKLAEIRINAGTITLSQANITDFRDNADYCGFVKGLIDQVDASGYIKIATEALQQDFETWFDGIKGQLSGDVAGNLQNQINDLDTKVEQVVSRSINEFDGTLSPSKGGTGVSYEDPVYSVFEGVKSKILYADKAEQKSYHASDNRFEKVTINVSTRFLSTSYVCENGDIYFLLLQSYTYYSSSQETIDLLIKVSNDGKVTFKEIPVQNDSRIDNTWHRMISSMIETDEGLICNVFEIPKNYDSKRNNVSINSQWGVYVRKYLINFDGTASATTTKLFNKKCYSDSGIGKTTNVATAPSGNQYAIVSVSDGHNTFAGYVLTIDGTTGEVSYRKINNSSSVAVLQDGSSDVFIAATDEAILFERSHNSSYYCDSLYKFSTNTITILNNPTVEGYISTADEPYYSDDYLFGSYPHGVFKPSNEVTKYGKAFGEHYYYYKGRLRVVRIAVNESSKKAVFIAETVKNIGSVVVEANGGATVVGQYVRDIYDDKTGKFLSIEKDRIADENGALLMQPHSLYGFFDQLISNPQYGENAIYATNDNVVAFVYAITGYAYVYILKYNESV